MYSAPVVDIYDLLHSGAGKDYGAEAADLAARIRAVHPAAHTVLDVACGTAEHARLLTERHGFAVDAIDLDANFARVARRKLPQALVVEADMRTFTIERRYDVVLCLFSSIGYVRTLDRVQQTLRRFAAHLAPGGVVLVEPWFQPGMFEAGRIRMQTAEAADVMVCRMSTSAVEGRLSRLYFEYLIGRAGRIERTSEAHELGLFTTGEMLACFEAAGLDATHDPAGPSGLGLFLARPAADAVLP